MRSELKVLGQLSSLAMLAFAAPPAFAGETPLYQPSPGWVRVAPLPDGIKTNTDSGPHFDWQVRFEGGQVSAYFDTAARISSPEILAQSSTLTLPWFPDKGDLILHEASIIRDGQTIDMLAGGKKLDVLRRERTLELRQLTGVLTATLEPEGLRVGDIVRLRATVTGLDQALSGKVQWFAPIIASPAKVSGASMTLTYPASRPVNWKILATDVSVKSERRGDATAVSIVLPVPKQPEFPNDAPGRFRHAPLIEASDFASWTEVSKVMAPLFVGAGKIEAGSPLADEVASIAKASADPEARAAMALRSVQDKIRYLAVAMNGGNYVPQQAEETWKLRYGDCKAKTLLLLAMLGAMNIEAEAVLASANLDDLVPKRLPSAGAFDHVFVRANVAGKVLWLDGTGSGTRLADLRDPPPMRHLLPLRLTGAELETVAAGPPSRPTVDIAVDADESTSVDLPTAVKVSVTLRGGMAASVAAMGKALEAKQQHDMLHQMMQSVLGEGQYVDLAVTSDVEAGTATITGRGVLTTPWRTEDRLLKRQLSKMPGVLEFTPDRARPAWAKIPVVTGGADRNRFVLKLRLPEKGRGIVSEGELTLDESVAGRQLARKVSQVGEIIEIDETVVSTGAEIEADAVARERDRLATIVARVPVLTAPADARRRWDFSAAELARSSQAMAIESIYARAVATAEPDDVRPYMNRASYRRGIGDRKGALADLSRAISVSPSIGGYLARADIAADSGDLAAALADAEAARKLDPSSQAAISNAAYLSAKMGKMQQAIALLDERIAMGGESKPELQLNKAAILGEFGEAADSLALYSELIAKKPGNPDLLNGRCWIKALRQIQLDTALKDCTQAIELSDNGAAILDSRAVVWLRMKRFDEALQDIDAALAMIPGQGPSRFIRSLILRQIGRTSEADKELAIALRLVPTIEKDYARYGLTH